MKLTRVFTYFATNSNIIPVTHLQQRLFILCYSTITERLVSELTCQVPHLYLWMAGVGYTVIPPELQTEVLTTPLRCAPIVLGELGPEVDLWSHAVYGYSDSGLPAPGDGPSVVRLSHRGNAHTGHKPTDCEMCGKNVAAELRHLGVGTWGEWSR